MSAEIGVIMVAKVCVFKCDPEIKRQSEDSHTPCSARQKKAHVSK
jgi:hypothetical protein